MQLLATRSDEFGDHEGLGLVPGRVVAIPSTGSDGLPHKIPHIGWTRLVRPHGPGSWDGSILGELAEGSYVYVVHSFTVVPDHPGHRLADCYYDGRIIAGAVRNGNIYGCQFHPEKSGAIGLSIIRQFCLSP
jgi:glutamine amidotransferase